MLLADIMTRLENMFDVLSTDGFSPMQQAYTDNWLHTGQQVRAKVHGTFWSTELAFADFHARPKGLLPSR